MTPPQPLYYGSQQAEQVGMHLMQAVQGGIQAGAGLVHQVNGSHRGPTAGQHVMQASRPQLAQNGGQAW